MEVKSLLMVMATLTIAGCSQNEMTEMNPDTNRTISGWTYIRKYRPEERKLQRPH